MNIKKFAAVTTVASVLFTGGIIETSLVQAKAPDQPVHRNQALGGQHVQGELQFCRTTLADFGLGEGSQAERKYEEISGYMDRTIELSNNDRSKETQAIHSDNGGVWFNVVNCEESEGPILAKFFKGNRLLKEVEVERGDMFSARTREEAGDYFVKIERIGQGICKAKAGVSLEQVPGQW